MCLSLNTKLENYSKFIKEVGFPILAFLLMYYMCNATMAENTQAIEELTRAVELLR